MSELAVLAVDVLGDVASGCTYDLRTSESDEKRDSSDGVVEGVLSRERSGEVAG